MTPAAPAIRTRATSPLVELCGSIAVAVPLLLTATSAAGSARWRADEAVVRTLGFVLAGGEGVVSALVGQLTMLVPVGSRLMRAQWAGALAAAVAAGAVYALALGVLRAHRVAPRLGPLLALCAALLATLGPLWNDEAATLGGASTAAALTLLGTWIAASGRLDARRWAGLGVLLALATLEQHTAGLALVAAVALTTILGGRLPRPRDLAYLAGFAVLGVGAVVTPVLLAGLGSSGAEAFGPAPLGTSLASPMLSVVRLGPFQAWASEVGPVSCILGAVGVVVGLFGARTRPRAGALATFVAAGAAFPAPESALPLPDPMAPVHLLASAALAIFVVLAVHAVALALLEAEVRFAEGAAVLLVVFTATLVLGSVDRRMPTEPGARPSAAEIWTAEALAELPAGSLLLVRTPAVAYRLWSARLTSGLRPDLVVVPMPWLSRGALSRQLLDLEPALAPLIRELAVVGEPSEYALSALADVRPLYVELDAGWDTRLVEHLLPRSFWLGFAPHALGRSDRASALVDGRGPFRRVLAEARRGAAPDDATLAVLAGRARQQAFVLAALGDREQIDPVLGDLRTIDPAHPFLTELERRLEADRRGRVDVHGLLE